MLTSLPIAQIGDSSNRSLIFGKFCSRFYDFLEHKNQALPMPTKGLHSLTFVSRWLHSLTIAGCICIIYTVSFHVAYSSFQGFEKGEGGKLKVVEKQAKIVRLIYQMFLDGQTPAGIARYLEDNNVLTALEKNKWYPSTVLSILTNVKYKGDALLQKTFTTDFLTGKRKNNQGEVQQYYVEKAHEAIIEPEEWNMVQEEIKRRAKLGKQFRESKVFASRLVCADCGAFYGPKVWHSTDKYRSEVWQCNRRFQNRKLGVQCDTPFLTEEHIKKSFIKAFNLLSKDKSKVLNHCKEFISILDNTEELNHLIETHTTEVEVIANMAKVLVEENTTTVIDQADYQTRYEALEKRYQSEQEKLDDLVKEKVGKSRKNPPSRCSSKAIQNYQNL